MEIEQIRIILLLLMLGIAGIFDFKTRKIPDVIWLIFGGIGTILYAWDYDKVTSYHMIAIITSIFVGVAIWRWNIAGLADCFAIITMAVILPVHYEFVMMPIVILIAASFLVVILVTLYNVSLNLSDIIRSKRLDVFSDFETESKIKKIFAFFVIHRKRKYERFVLFAESSISVIPNKKSFVFLSSRNKRITGENQINLLVMYVQTIPPLIAFVSGITLSILLPEFVYLYFE